MKTPLPLLLGLLLLTTPAAARNIELSTLSPRESLQLTIYNAEDLTLVRETRRVAFKPGINPLLFSWQGGRYRRTRMDPTSVELRFLSHADKLEVLEAVFPEHKPRRVYWQVQSELDGEALVEITYFTAGLEWTARYIGITDAATLHLENYVWIMNRSGLDYENAQVRLVLGKINLQENMWEMDAGMKKVAERYREELRRRAEQADFTDQEEITAEELALLSELKGMTMAELGEGPEEPFKKINKENLSEYVLYTIEGTETLRDDWATRLRSFAADGVPFNTVYRHRPEEYGPGLVRLLVLNNDSAAGLGTTPLPDGRIHVFRDHGQGRLSFLGAQETDYIPVGDQLELNLGADPAVYFDLVPLQVFRDEIGLSPADSGIYRKIGSGFAFDPDWQVAGWDEHTLYSQRIRNHHAQPVRVEIRRAYSGGSVFRSRLQPVLYDYRTVEFSTTVPAGHTVNLCHEVVRRHGDNRDGDSVALHSGFSRPVPGLCGGTPE